MASPSIASYFNVRKRAAADDIVNARNKVLRLDSADGGDHAQVGVDRNILAKNQLADADLRTVSGGIATKVVELPPAPSVKPSEKRVTRRTTKRTTAETAKNLVNQPKIVKFTLGGTLSPRKKAKESNPVFQAVKTNSTEKNATPVQVEAKTTKAAIVNKSVITTKKKELSFDDIKAKVTRSAKLNELKSILSKHQQLSEQYQACVNNRKQLKMPNGSVGEGKGLKQFETIELEVLSSPQKGLRTPTKTPVKEAVSAGSSPTIGLMSPKQATPRQLFSPIKANPVPAYQRYQTLVDSTATPTLQLPFKYRSLLEVFRCVDSICSMFYNRKETITFKKLKPAVQRMLRKNFTENHLAQIKYLFPDAYDFHQKKMLNPGSHTKYDYYQLVITPNVQPSPNTDAAQTTVSIDEENIVRNADAKLMNPQIMIVRYQTFQNLLLDRVKVAHDAFLKSLTPPLNIPMGKIRRWHQDFDLESCPEILPSDLPQPPNIEKFSSAKDILSTARNLFNCATPMERMMERYETKKQESEAANPEEKNDGPTQPTTPSTTTIVNPVDKVLKGVPKSLLEKIRAKQAAKALDAMTRRPSQDAEASKFARLPELARYIRNIFVTENKGVLELDKVLAKLENSFREKISREILRELLELMAKEAPRHWLSFHFIRKTDFIKINRHENLSEVIKELEQKAQAKAE